MKNLATYFENPFTNVRISLDRKKAFGEDTIERITVQNTNNHFNALLIATENVQEALFGGITNLSADRAVRKARTQSTDKIMKDFKARNSKLNAYFIANDIDELEVYSEFFPQGITAFTNEVNKENVEQRMATLITAITNNTEIAGGATVLQEYNDFLSNYKKARSAQLNKSGEVSTGIDVLDEIEADWDDQMFSNLLTFANLNRNQPENIKLYMDPSLLEPDVRHGTTLTGKLKGTVTDSAGHPVNNVVVHILDGSMDNAHSDANGVYVTHQLPIGTWQVEYSKGNRKINKLVEIKQGEALNVDIVL